MNSKRNIVIGVIILLVAWAGIRFFAKGNKEPKASYETATVGHNDISSSITATGSIEPVTSVEVGTQVSGIVSKIFVDYNSVVTKGQVIAELDKTNLLSELSTAKSNCASARSEMNYQKSNYGRYKVMHDKGLISDNDFESARLAYIKAKENYQTSLNSVAKAETNLGYATITSPIDGVVLSKAVEEGQTVAASFSTPTLFTIAQDLTDMRVIADIDEADIGEVREGQRVTFTVDAYPNDTFSGKVTQVRQEATTESNVVTYEVVISAPNNDLKLKPGLTANVTIYTMEKKNALSVPAKALRFTPNENLMGKDEKIVDCQGKDKVWVMEGKNLKAVPVKTGTTNGTLTEIVSGLKAGAVIVTDFNITGAAGREEESQDNSNPFMPGPPGKNKNKK
ncbi:MAG: efflux RND transporter periplasmic adaptor subunit [Bacteroidales bacterium]|nr:efflux RND transporter periplasmic adaptor subunit [Bacteroidales bacterium]MCM1146409.1 efflux RND transporter periplasmic adaptor subunit [Bacteroidales bacterium]MCM1205153.1 efflux RND transporter periplasmic adaptor subunit [Bacillota bacterium]MCM1509400.1 efflux RND transporter periplasmic adaptor subunit [Clostridium sp.]